MINFVEPAEIMKYQVVNEQNLVKYKELLINTPRKIHYHNYVFALNYKKLMDKFTQIDSDAKQKFIKARIQSLFSTQVDEAEREAIVQFIQDMTDSTCFDWLLAQ